MSHRSPRRVHAAVDLVLYVSSTSTYSRTAIRNCETLLKQFDAARVRLEVCDVRLHPDRADEDSVCYTPVLVKRNPLPRTYLVGDLSNTSVLLDLLSACGVEPAR